MLLIIILLTFTVLVIYGTCKLYERDSLLCPVFIILSITGVVVSSYFCITALTLNGFERETITEYYAVKDVLKSDLMQTDNFYLQKKIYDKALYLDSVIDVHKRNLGKTMLTGLYSEEISKLEPLNLHYAVKEAKDTTLIK